MASYSQSSVDNLSRSLLDVVRRTVEDTASQQLQEALQLQAQEMRRMAEEAARQEQALRRLERQLQERDEALHTLRVTVDDRMQRIEQRMNRVEETARGRLRWWFERGRTWDSGTVGELESRMEKMEGALHRALVTMFPRVEALVARLESTSPPATSNSASASSCPSSPSASTSPTVTAPTSPNIFASLSPNIFASLSSNISISTSPSTSTSPNISASTSPNLSASTSPNISASTSASTAATTPTSRPPLISDILLAAPPSRLSDASSLRAYAATFSYASTIKCPTVPESPAVAAYRARCLAASASAADSTSAAPPSDAPVSTASTSALGATATHKPVDSHQRQLVERRVEEVMAKRDQAKTTPSALGEDLCRAAVEGNIASVQNLLSSGADVNYIGTHGGCPLTSMFLLEGQTGKCNPALLSTLLEAGADVNAVNLYGYSALHFAACVDVSGRCVRALVGAGAQLNARDVEGGTPLHSAAEQKNLAAVRELLAAGADKRVRGWGGRFKNKTPLELAACDPVRDILRD